MLNDDITITKTAEDARYDLAGARTAYIRVEYFIGKHGPFVERFEKASYSAQVRDDKLNAFAAEVRT